MRRLTLLSTFLLAIVLSLASGLAGAPLLAQDAAAGPSIGSGLLTGLAPIATVLLTSGLTWAANTGLGIMADWSNLLKYAAMGVVGVVVSVLLGALGHTVSTDPSTWTAATGQGMAAALIYKLGQKA
jgi:hypothetical protein